MYMYHTRSLCLCIFQWSRRYCVFNMNFADIAFEYSGTFRLGTCALMNHSIEPMENLFRHTMCLWIIVNYFRTIVTFYAKTMLKCRWISLNFHVTKWWNCVFFSCNCFSMEFRFNFFFDVLWINVFQLDGNLHITQCFSSTFS